MIQIKVNIDVPDGKYCCTCEQVATNGDFRSCAIFRVPIRNDEHFYLKCEECLELSNERGFYQRDGK